MSEYVQTQAQTVDEFCRAHGICRATFYNLLKRGIGPRVMTVGSVKRISVEAAADWRRQMEETGKKAA